MTKVTNRNYRALRLLRFPLAAIVLCSTWSSAQTTSQNLDITNVTATPIPGVGHDYIHDLSEVVSPANGSVSNFSPARNPFHELDVLNFRLSEN